MTASSDRALQQLQLLEVKPGIKFSIEVLGDMLPDVETALFFGKVYDLDVRQLSSLVYRLFKTGLTQALSDGSHSTDLQDFLVGLGFTPQMDSGDIVFDPDTTAKGEILPQVWQSLQIDVAQEIKDVAAKLESVVSRLPGKQGSMVFQSLAVLNKQRPVVGDYRARIHHARQADNLLILDVSGSMSESTVSTIVDDVVALAYTANAHLAVVSDTCTHWEPGTYDSTSVLSAAEFSGTHYEQLQPLLNRDWGVVITVADYDSSYSAKEHIGNTCVGAIDTVLDVSLVNKPTFLAECVGQLATKVTPILVAADHANLVSTW